MNLTLPTNSEVRKEVPMLSGCLKYFPAALMGVAQISMSGDRKHNPENQGPPMHARGKSMDHGDCIIRHTMDLEDMLAAVRRGDPEAPSIETILAEVNARSWRALADAQEIHEKLNGAPLAPAAVLPETLRFEGVETVFDTELAALKSAVAVQRAMEPQDATPTTPSGIPLREADTKDHCELAGCSLNAKHLGLCLDSIGNYLSPGRHRK